MGRGRVAIGGQAGKVFEVRPLGDGCRLAEVAVVVD